MRYFTYVAGLLSAHAFLLEGMGIHRISWLGSCNKRPRVKSDRLVCIEIKCPHATATSVLPDEY